jgi:hypothetical protein
MTDPNRRTTDEPLPPLGEGGASQQWQEPSQTQRGPGTGGSEENHREEWDASKSNPAFDDERGHGIPAANIGNTDLVALALTDPAAAKEIARLEDLMNRGEESKEEFLRLCQLLYDVGSREAAEILLRRNLDHYEGEALYLRLFGTTKPDEYAAAIETFKSQFGVELRLVKQDDFLVKTFHSDGGPVRSDSFAVLSNPCVIKIGHIERDRVEADVTPLDADRDVFDLEECLLLFFVDGAWTKASPL